MATSINEDTSEQEINIKVKKPSSLDTITINVGQMKELTPEHKVLLKSINQELWADGVEQKEFESAIYGLNNAYEEMEHTISSPLFAMPMHVPPCDTQTFLRAQVLGDTRTILRAKVLESFTWIGLYMSTIQRVPFLEAFCSDRWTKNTPILTSVNLNVLRLVDYVFASGRDFVKTPITMMNLEKFSLSREEFIRDLDFLNVECKTEDLESIDIEDVCSQIRATSWSSQDSYTKQESREAAETLILALSDGKLKYTQLSHPDKNRVYEAVLFVTSHFRVFGKNQRKNMKEATKLVPFSCKQKEKLQYWNIVDTHDYKVIDDDSESDDSDYGNYGESDYYYDSD